MALVLRHFGDMHSHSIGFGTSAWDSPMDILRPDAPGQSSRHNFFQGWGCFFGFKENLCFFFQGPFVFASFRSFVFGPGAFSWSSLRGFLASFPLPLLWTSGFLDS